MVQLLSNENGYKKKFDVFINVSNEMIFFITTINIIEINYTLSISIRFSLTVLELHLVAVCVYCDCTVKDYCNNSFSCFSHLTLKIKRSVLFLINFRFCILSIII